MIMDVNKNNELFVLINDIPFQETAEELLKINFKNVTTAEIKDLII